MSRPLDDEVNAKVEALRIARLELHRANVARKEFFERVASIVRAQVAKSTRARSLKITVVPVYNTSSAKDLEDALENFFVHFTLIVEDENYPPGDNRRTACYLNSEQNVDHLFSWTPSDNGRLASISEERIERAIGTIRESIASHLAAEVQRATDLPKHEEREAEIKRRGKEEFAERRRREKEEERHTAAEEHKKLAFGCLIVVVIFYFLIRFISHLLSLPTH